MRDVKAVSQWFRALTIFLCLCMVLSLAACGGGESTSSDVSSDITDEISGETSKKPTKTKKTTKTKKPTKTTSATTSSVTGATAGTTAGNQKPTDGQTTTTTKKATTTAPALKDGKLLASDFILNPSIHKSRYFGGDGVHTNVDWTGPFVDSSTWLYGPDTSVEPLKNYGFYATPQGTGKPMPNHLSEWGNYWLNVAPGYTNAFCGGTLLPDVGYRLDTPTDRADALRIIKDWVFRQFKPFIPDPNNIKQLDTCTGFYLWNQYALEWGATSLGAEVGETIQHTQASIAFVRGGSRQYDVPGWVDMSAWYGMDTYQGLKGHSPSLSERTAMAAIMAGSASVMAEAGGWSMLPETGNTTQLNELGLAYKNVVDFIKKNKNLGYSYAPFGIVLDYYHGMDRCQVDTKKVFGYFHYNEGDYMVYDVFDLFFPGGWETEWDETHYLVNGPYGDTCDALLQNASQDVLNSYPCLIFAGNVKLSGEEKNRYVNYVKQGGTLVLNTGYLSQFADYQSKYNGENIHEFADGKGTVIVYGPHYEDMNLSALEHVMAQLMERHVPFAVSEQIEYLINIRDGAMLVTLINNDGWKKVPGKQPVVDYSRSKDVTVTFTGNLKVKDIKEIYDGTTVSRNGKAASVTVAPGEIKVLEFKFN